MATRSNSSQWRRSQNRSSLNGRSARWIARLLLYSCASFTQSRRLSNMPGARPQPRVGERLAHRGGDPLGPVTHHRRRCALELAEELDVGLDVLLGERRHVPQLAALVALAVADRG